jgi:hypothetical protein
MHARVVRFTNVTPERIEAVQKRVEEAGGPPEGVESTGFKLLHDDSQGTAIFIGFFDDEQKLRKSSEVLEAMEPGDTPGERASVDLCEVKVEGDA